MGKILFSMIMTLIGFKSYGATINLEAGGSIQSVINDANNGDKIIVSSGTYNELIDFSGKNISIECVKDDSFCILDGDTDGDGVGNGSVVTFSSQESSSAVLNGFTIQNGFASYGGGIYIYDNSNPTLINLTIKSNEAYGGGGVYISTDSSPTLSSLIVSGNNAEYGGGVYIKINSNPTLNRFFSFHYF